MVFCFGLDHGRVDINFDNYILVERDYITVKQNSFDKGQKYVSGPKVGMGWIGANFGYFGQTSTKSEPAMLASYEINTRRVLVRPNWLDSSDFKELIGPDGFKLDERAIATGNTQQN